MPLIRPVRYSDAEHIATIYNYYVEHTVITFEEVTINAKEMEQRITTAQTNNLPWLVAEQDSVVVGYAYASKWKERSAYRHSVEVTVYVAHTASRQGVGRCLYNHLFKELKASGINAVMGGIALPNPASIALHESFGLEKVAHFKQVGCKFGQWVDVAYWQKLLNN
jgi:phosphinothricin acetyltransferase